MSAISYSTFKSDFRINRRIGKGNCATVSEVYHPIEKRYYALKSSQFSSVEQLIQAYNEIQTILSIDDERIVKIYYYYAREIEQSGKIELGIIMELCGLNLADYIKVRKNKLEFPERTELRDFLSSFVAFFAKLQRKGYMHRDVKPENILLAKNSSNKKVYKIADFGYAIKMNIYSTLNIAGTMEYVSPKLLAKFKDNKITVPGHNYKDDVYSFGKTFFQFMTLEINCNLDSNKLDQCAIRYGVAYSDLVTLMTKYNQTERPDFIYLQNYLIRRGMIDVQITVQMKKAMQSLSILKLAKEQSKDYQENDNSLQFNKQKSKNNRASRYTGLTRKKRKQTQLNNSATLLQRSRSKSKIQKKRQQTFIGKSINFGKEIFCMTVCQDLIFIGSQAKFGVMIIPTEKIIKFTLQVLSKVITYMKVDEKKKNLLIASLEGRFYIISISQIRKKIDQRNKQQSIQQIPHQNFKYQEFHLENSISVFDSFRDQDGTQSFIFGHHTGQISILKRDQVYSQCSLLNQQITCIKLHKGYIFFCNAAGIFKKQAATSLGMLAIIKKEKFNVNNLGLTSKQYKYHDQPFLTFEIISHSKGNDKRSEAYKYLAYLISSDGFLHIISNTMKCQRLVRISDSQILSCHFQIEPQLQYGLKGWVLGSQGIVYSEQGEIIEKKERKNLSIIAINDKKMVFGTLDKEIIIGNRKRQAIINID